MIIYSRLCALHICIQVGHRLTEVRERHVTLSAIDREVCLQQLVQAIATSPVGSPGAPPLRAQSSAALPLGGGLTLGAGTDVASARVEGLEPASCGRTCGGA